MRKRIRPFTAGFFTDETATALIEAFHQGWPRPAAMHMEPQSVGWMSSADIEEGHQLEIWHHAEACARLLAGAPDHDTSGLYDTGLFDEYPHKGRPAFRATAIHPNIRVMTISSTQMFMDSFGYKDYTELAKPVVLKAAGNKGDDWLSFRATETLSGEVYMPGFLRVGECQSTGEVGKHSQISGPAFICPHPEDMDVILKGRPFHATKEEAETFLRAQHDPRVTIFHGRRRAIFQSYEPPAKSVDQFPGTSASAPYAGSLVMRHSVGMDGITSYDIIPAMLMAAQMNEPPQDAMKRLETQAGFIFDPFQYGHGVLVNSCLQQRLRDLWEIRAKLSGKATKEGEYSGPLTVEGRGFMSARTEKAQGPVVSTVLTLSFVNDEEDRNETERRIPEFIMLRSPHGTMIPLPLLYDRKVRYGPYVRAGYQTSAFFGEDISKGEWQIMYAQTDENPLPIASMKIVAHTMHPKSPGLVLLRAFQKSLAKERGREIITPPALTPDPLKPA